MTARLQTLALAMALSEANGAGISWAWRHARDLGDAATRASRERQRAGACPACSDGVIDLRDLADDRN
ncbi:hypothetical protein [Pseudacidovorax intermedius]|uniref:hypothetical protein n=1 Tax=Pseudacidovorax intermedius TaxID=433924 RepID=UPI0005C28C0D|nr:hypothetical protein [Pseudacidovorax intermedius]